MASNGESSYSAAGVVEGSQHQSGVQQTDNGSNKPPRTPQRSSQPATARSARRNTPGAGRFTPGAGRFNPPKSPYMKVAYERGRRLSQSRRKSINRQHRDSDRDILIKLSRKLAPGSEFPDATPRPAPVTPQVMRAVSERPSTGIVLYNDRPVEDAEDSEDLAAPPLVNFEFNGYNEEDESDDIIRPPRLMSEEPISGVRRRSRRISMEQGRRARGRISDHSLFGGMEELWAGQRGRNSTGQTLTSNPVRLDLGDDSIPFLGSPSGLAVDSDQQQMLVLNEDERLLLDETYNAMLSGSEDDFQMDALPTQDEEMLEEEQTVVMELFDGVAEEDQAAAMEQFDELPDDEDFEVPADDDKDAMPVSSKQKPRERKKKPMNVTEDGIEYPIFPKRVVKKLAAKQGMKISNETLNALMSVTDEFFAQSSACLGRYAQHAGRRSINDDDVLLLMQRQRQTNVQTTAFSLAQKHLPRELLQEIRMAGTNSKRGRR
ncbi:centromere kinetochore component CENP-T-domain-containing protein [Sphaerosporella brunnea]|uniref:Centromere kinetochore component CENP-T-domain-containing protein n=1 Tax=Sphaerosporella brunnea TaxID=1250544 RepID=A0A5J5ERF9_9PEZI|nr:centromere kinetochore component CENP-T-domain-containing protein [Sphaerosporella brunnea]